MFEDYLQAKLSPPRLEHSRHVAEVAEKLAVIRGIDRKAAFQAGLLHDVAREIPAEQLIAIAENEGLISDPMEKFSPILLHGPVGAFMIKQDLGISAGNVLQAVAQHTTGHDHMTDLDAVIYLADIIEPGRNFAEVERLRQAAFQDFWQTVVLAMDCSLKHVVENNQLLHPLTVKARNRLLMDKFYKSIQGG